MINSQFNTIPLDNRSNPTIQIPTVASIKKKVSASQVCIQSETDLEESSSDQLRVWGWPTRPKKLIGPSKYHLPDLFSIPTGSIYFASRKGPLSDINTYLTGSPYDMIGIVFQSRTSGHEGTYIYTMDSTIYDSSVNNKVVVIKLSDLIRDDTIIHHAVLPLKDCDDECFGYNRDSHKWRAKMREQRNQIFRNLFKKYREMTPEFDAYQTLASIVGLPVAESLRSKNAFTSSELIGLILFEAGLIWDDRFSTDNRNPICGYDKCFFQRLADDELNPEQAEITLITPGVYRGHLESDSSSIDDASSSSSEKTPLIIPSEPISRIVFAKTINFGTLRPVDFLQDYYQAIGIDPEKQKNKRAPSTSSDLIQMIESFVSENSKKNRLNMSWYHDYLITIELNNNQNENCRERISSETIHLKDLLEKLRQDFLQKRILHFDNANLNEKRLLRICRQTSELAAELHNLACECQSDVVSKHHDRQYPAERFDSDGNDQTFKFATLVQPEKDNIPEYVLILHRYMWGSDWAYAWSSPFKANSEEYYQMSSRLKKLLGEIIETSNRTPDNCILLEVLICLQHQAQNLYEYLLSCQKYVVQPSSREYRRYTKRDDSSRSDWYVSESNE